MAKVKMETHPTVTLTLTGETEIRALFLAITPERPSRIISGDRGQKMDRIAEDIESKLADALNKL